MKCVVVRSREEVCSTSRAIAQLWNGETVGRCDRVCVIDFVTVHRGTGSWNSLPQPEVNLQKESSVLRDIKRSPGQCTF